MTRTLALTLFAAATLSIRAHAAAMRTHAGSYELQVLTNGQPVRSFWHSGENWVLGQLGERYTLRVVNHSGRPVEAVVSVDGRDVVDGQPGDAQKRGYLVPAFQSVDIDGWRVSQAQAAAFRFTSVANSYAARTGSGREVGVIGVAIFEQRPPPVVYHPVPRPRYDPYAEKSCCSSGFAQREKTMDRQGAAAAPSAATPPMAPPPAPADSAMGDSAVASKAQRKEERAGLGTEYGEAVDSYITNTTFDRASYRPAVVLGCRYNDRSGLIALGINVDGMTETAARQTADPFPVVERGFAPPPPEWRP